MSKAGKVEIQCHNEEVRQSRRMLRTISEAVHYSGNEE